jgi:uncharacterized membrane protein YgcG
MKKILVALALFAVAAFAEPSFEQMQELIGQKNYAAAEQGLEVILQAHPTSAKAFYSMSQAQAGLGHLDKAQLALNKARGLDPSLKFASEDNIKALEQAITPQAAKIEAVEPSHFWRNLILVLIGVIAGVAFYFYRKKDRPADEKVIFPTPPDAQPAYDSPSDKAYMEEHNLNDAIKESYTPKKRGRPAKVTPAPVATPSPSAYVRTYTPAPTPVYQAPPQPVIVNNNSGSDMLTGVMIGSMMNNNHHDRTTVIEREVIVERPSRSTYVAPEPAYEAPAPSRSSSWDDTPAKSSSWNDDSSSKSSSWGSSSSSDSSSSWSSSDSSSSSSSDSGSSSSWD